MPKAEGGCARSDKGWSCPRAPPLSLRDISPRWGAKIPNATHCLAPIFS